MYHRDHLPPHFHVFYAEDEAKITIDPIGLLEGDVPRPIRKLVFKWAARHQAELRANWELAVARLPLVPIAPHGRDRQP